MPTQIVITVSFCAQGTDEIAVPVISASVAVFVLVVVLLMVVTCCGLIAMKRKRKGNVNSYAVIHIMCLTIHTNYKVVMSILLKQVLTVQ